MKPRKAAVIFIFITVTLDMLALGLIAPVLPKLVLNFLGGDAPNAPTLAAWKKQNSLDFCAFCLFLHVGSFEQYESARFFAFVIVDSAHDLL